MEDIVKIIGFYMLACLIWHTNCGWIGIWSNEPMKLASECVELVNIFPNFYK